jgi:hypothetical protein
LLRAIAKCRLSIEDLAALSVVILPIVLGAVIGIWWAWQSRR